MTGDIEAYLLFKAEQELADEEQTETEAENSGPETYAIQSS